MKRYTYVSIALILLGLLSCSLAVSDSLRSSIVGMVSPFRHHPSSSTELEQLKLENYHYRLQIEQLKAQLTVEKRIDELALQYQKERRDSLFQQIERLKRSVIGSVVYRESASWTSSVWVDVGENLNRERRDVVIGKNSPVVVGTSVVGVVEYVGESRSRIRLMTDSSLTPSVGIGESGLVRGELQGGRDPLWRKRGLLLQGKGFAAAFTERDKPISVRQGERVFTTGLDGVFPAGLSVGTVARIYPLEEGSPTFDIDVQPDVDFDKLTFLLILPPSETS